MNYATIKKFDVANGEGVRVSLFVSGCTHHCKGCFNSEAWDFNYGSPYTDETKQEILTALSPDYIKGLSLLGGEPFEPKNQVVLVELLREFKELYPDKDVWCYSGYTLEQLTSSNHPHTDVTDEMLSYIDILVDGKFEEDKKNLSLRFKGSENQRIISLRESLNKNKIILAE